MQSQGDMVLMYGEVTVFEALTDSGTEDTKEREK